MSIEKIDAQIKKIEENISKKIGNYFAAKNKIKSLEKERQKLIDKDLQQKKEFEENSKQINIFYE